MNELKLNPKFVTVVVTFLVTSLVNWGISLLPMGYDVPLEVQIALIGMGLFFAGRYTRKWIKKIVPDYEDDRP